MTEYNPRYIEYCKRNNRSPDRMLEYDKIRFPGGCMCGFILWISEKWSQFDKRHPEFNPHMRTKEEQNLFDQELKQKSDLKCPT